RVAVAADVLGANDQAVRGRHDRVACGSGDVDALVAPAPVRHGVVPGAETGGEDAADRSDGGSRGDPTQPLLELRGDLIEMPGHLARPLLDAVEPVERAVHRRTADARLGLAERSDAGDDRELVGPILRIAESLLELGQAGFERGILGT